MLSRIGRVIDNYRERVAFVLLGFGILFLMSVAGTDDYNTAQHIFTPLLPLVVKTGFGLLIMVLGVRVLKGGRRHESDC